MLQPNVVIKCTLYTFAVFFTVFCSVIRKICHVNMTQQVQHKWLSFLPLRVKGLLLDIKFNLQ